MPTEAKYGLIKEANEVSRLPGAEETRPVVLLEEIQRRGQVKILELFGTIDFDPTYGYKQNRRLDRVLIDESQAGR